MAGVLLHVLAFVSLAAAGPAAILSPKSDTELSDLMKSGNRVVLGYFGPNSGPAKVAFEGAVQAQEKSSDVAFAVTGDGEVAKKYGLESSPALKVFAAKGSKPSAEFDFFSETGFDEEIISKFLVSKAHTTAVAARLARAAEAPTKVTMSTTIKYVDENSPAVKEIKKRKKGNGKLTDADKAKALQENAGMMDDAEGELVKAKMVQHIDAASVPAIDSGKNATLALGSVTSETAPAPAPGPMGMMSGSTGSYQKGVDAAKSWKQWMEVSMRNRTVAREAGGSTAAAGSLTSPASATPPAAAADEMAVPKALFNDFCTMSAKGKIGWLRTRHKGMYIGTYPADGGVAAAAAAAAAASSEGDVSRDLTVLKGGGSGAAAAGGKKAQQTALAQQGGGGGKKAEVVLSELQGIQMYSRGLFKFSLSKGSDGKSRCMWCNLSEETLAAPSGGGGGAPAAKAMMRCDEDVGCVKEKPHFAANGPWYEAGCKEEIEAALKP